ncbi:MAG: hypothetical protein ACYST5_10655, partial [Planctomycetota bacterium]
MSKPRFLIEPLGRRSLPVILASFLLLIMTVSEMTASQENEGVDTQKIIRRVVEDYIRDGKEQYESGFFERAEKTFLMARGYEEYLTAARREELNKLLEKAQMAVLERKRTAETFRTANELIKQDQLIKAKAHLEKIKDYEFLTPGERGQIAEALRQIDIEITEGKAYSEKAKEKRPLITEKPQKIAEEVKKSSDRPKERKEKIAGLYYRSIGFFYTGQFEKAHEGFVEVLASGLMPASVEKKIEGYLAEIDGLLAERAAQKPVKEEKDKVVAVNKLEVIEPRVAGPSVVKPGIAELKLDERRIAEPSLVKPEVVPQKVTAPAKRDGSYIDVINLRRNILRSHTTAVVNDAIVKAQKYINAGQFYKAKEAVETAERIVNDNQLAVGDDLFTEQNNAKLRQLMEEIVQRQDEMTRLLAEQRREDAIKAQQEFREQMEIERQSRIVELMNNALAYQEQKRYEAALGQLESLLALDPQHNQALALKSELEDIIYFRKQLEVEKEADRQRADILLKTDESGIPYAEEITYPKNWREIIQKPTRQPDKPIGLDPADVAVYEQLDQIVDLSELTATMSLSDAMDLIRNSVDPPLKIVVLWRDLLDNAEIERGTEINMDGLPEVRLGTGLENLLNAVAGAFAELDYVVEKGVITIATIESLPSKLEPRVYDITDLVGQPAQYGGIQGLFMGQSLSRSLGGGGLGGGGL